MSIILSDNELFRQLRRNNSTSGIIWGFRDAYDFLSHMYPAKVTAYNVLYPAVENAYHACMTTDLEWREKIRKSTPKQSKYYSHFMPVREDKDKIKLTVMYLLDLRKFQNNPVLLKRLCDTGNKRLVEGNIWCDNFWGDCGCNKCKEIRGENWAGKILMQVREKLC